MGKRRGRRFAAALDQARWVLGLDASAVFIGYGVQHIRSQDFLALYQRYSSGLEVGGWSADLSNAIRFRKYSEAQYVAKRFIDGVQIVMMIEGSGQYYFVPVD